MERQLIDDLLTKYLAGETSVTEEQVLRDFFVKTEDLPEDLLPYKDLFTFFEIEQNCQFEGDILLPQKRSYKKLFGALAVAAMLAGILIMQPFDANTKSIQGDAHIEAQNAKELLMMFGKMPQESQQNLNYIEELKLFKLDQVKSAANDSTDALLDVKRITHR